MSVLRAVGRAVFVFLFTTFLSLLIFVLATAQLTSYKSLKPITVDMLKQQINLTSEELNSIYTNLTNQCQTSGNETIYFQSLELKCSDVSKITYADLPELIANTTFDNIYFKKYDCSFIQCIQLPEQEKFKFLMSKQANEFFEKIIFYLEVATVLSAIVLVAVVENWSERFKTLGISLVFIGIFYFLIPIMKSYATQQLPQQTLTKASPMINQVFDSISGNLLIVFIAGIILTAIGLVIGYLSKRKEAKEK